MRRPPIRPRRTAVVTAAAISVLLAGCGSGAAEVTEPPADTAAYPVVASGQARSVLDAVEGALARGVTAKDTAKTVDARLLGPYRALALAGARVLAQEKKQPAEPADVQRLRLIVPTATSWPRFFVAVGTSSASSTPVLRVLTCASARAPYGLWAEAMMLPGATLPPTAAAETGAPAVSPNASGLVATPKEVVSGYAGYLNQGAKAGSKVFAPSSYSDQLIQALAKDRKAVKPVGGTVTSTHTAAGTPLAVRTADGGALVIGQLDQKYVITVKKGKGSVKIQQPDQIALAQGKKKFSTSFTRTALEVVVFHVPPRGQGTITVIAAEKGDVQAVAK